MKNAKRKWQKWEKCLYCKTPVEHPNFDVIYGDKKEGCVCNHCAQEHKLRMITYWNNFEQDRLWWEQRLKESFEFQELLEIPARQKIINKWANDILKKKNKKIAEHIRQLTPYTEKQMKEL